VNVETSQPGPDRSALYKVAYDEAARALSEQLTLVDSFRTRAGLLLSVAALTTSFLTARALDGGVLNVASWAALASFVGVAVVSLAILWPRRWEFSASPEELIRDHIETEALPEPVPVGCLHRDLASYMQMSRDENSKGLGELVLLLQLASGLLAVETVLWIAAIASMS
jgi:hypothetical protein